MVPLSTERTCCRSGEENGAGLAAHSCFGVDYELSLILKEIRVITDQVTSSETPCLSHIVVSGYRSQLFNVTIYFSDAQGRRGCGHFARLEVRRHGRGQTVPYYLYPVHNHRHASRAAVRAAHHGVVATRPLADAHAKSSVIPRIFVKL